MHIYPFSWFNNWSPKVVTFHCTNTIAKDHFLISHMGPLLSWFHPPKQGTTLGVGTLLGLGVTAPKTIQTNFCTTIHDVKKSNLDAPNM